MIPYRYVRIRYENLSLVYIYMYFSHLTVGDLLLLFLDLLQVGLHVPHPLLQHGQARQHLLPGG